MLEYVFFHTLPRDSFVDFLVFKGLSPQIADEDELLQVLLPEDIDDDLSGEIEEKYDEMMALNRSLYEDEGEGEEVGFQSAGISLHLKDGNAVYAQVDPLVLGRIMQAVTPEEFSEVVHAIVSAVEDPDARRLCQRLRDEGKIS